MSADAGEPSCPANIGVTMLGDGRWVMFRRWSDDPATDEFWDGQGWSKDAGRALPLGGMSHAVRLLLQGDDHPWYKADDGYLA
jgi:hypothetical protein